MNPNRKLWLLKELTATYDMLNLEEKEGFSHLHQLFIRCKLHKIIRELEQ